MWNKTEEVHKTSSLSYDMCRTTPTNLGATENLSQSTKFNERALNTADLFSTRILFEAMFWKPKESKIKKQPKSVSFMGTYHTFNLFFPIISLQPAAPKFKTSKNHLSV